jgi:hypothetical protein
MNYKKFKQKLNRIILTNIVKTENFGIYQKVDI